MLISDFVKNLDVLVSMGRLSRTHRGQGLTSPGLADGTGATRKTSDQELDAAAEGDADKLQEVQAAAACTHEALAATRAKLTRADLGDPVPQVLAASGRGVQMALWINLTVQPRVAPGDNRSLNAGLAHRAASLRDTAGTSRLARD